MRKLSIVAAIAIVSSFAPLAFAGEAQDFTIHNKTGLIISELHVEANGADSWGKDILGVDVLGDGDSTKIDFEGYGETCDFGILLKDDKGNEYELETVDLCKTHDLTFEMQGGKVVYAQD